MRRTAQRKAVVKTKSVPAPVGGLNARDAIAEMAPTDAIIMDNWFAEPSYVSLREGSANWATGLPGWVESLMTYSSAAGRKMFAASVTAFYDATSAGAVGAGVVTGLTNARWQHLNFGTPGGQFMYTVNGVDKPRLYDGTTWTAIDGISTPAITGVTTTKLIHVNAWKSRLWFTEKDSFRMWYLPLNSIGGAASSIDFSSMFKLGGYMMCMVTWTIHTQNGTDEFAVFISSEGEVAVYQGIDPASASTFAIVGLFRIGRPIGRRCYTKVGSDVLLLTADGFFMLSKALITEQVSRAEAISDKIVNLVNADVQLYNANFGWQPVLFPMGNKILINVPQTENSVQYQYVMNTISQQWSRYTGWNAACFELMGDNLFYGGNTVVVNADVGMDDNGVNIVGDVKPAFNYFGSSGQKKFNMVRPIFVSNGLLSPALDMNVDFNETVPTATPTFSGFSGSPWDSSPWNTSLWGGSNQITKNWITVNGVGFCGTIRMRIATNLLTVKWQSTDFVYEEGGIL